jgi:hypothetical protein
MGKRTEIYTSVKAGLALNFTLLEVGTEETQSPEKLTQITPASSI